MTRITGIDPSMLTWTQRGLQCNRYMGLNDLSTEIRQDPSVFQGDESVENRVLDQVLFLVEDKISEVKNQAVKWQAIYLLSKNYSHTSQPWSAYQNTPPNSNGGGSRQTD